MSDQLSLFDLEGDDLTDDEKRAIVSDFLARYSDAETTAAALRPKPCRCEPDGMPWWDGIAFERRCARCGRQP